MATAGSSSATPSATISSGSIEQHDIPRLVGSVALAKDPGEAGREDEIEDPLLAWEERECLAAGVSDDLLSLLPRQGVLLQDRDDQVHDDSQASSPAALVGDGLVS